MEINNHLLLLTFIAAAAIATMFLLSDYDWHLPRCQQVTVLEERRSESVIDTKATLMNESHSSTQRFFRSAHLQAPFLVVCRRYNELFILGDSMAKLLVEAVKDELVRRRLSYIKVSCDDSKCFFAQY